MIDLKINVPSDFYKEETRYGGYVVSSQMKQIWAVQIDLLKEFERVCEKLNLRYSMHSGSMLGAVRHQGFIPWDDDIDIFMPRKDYNILIKNSNEFEYPYFLQSPYTDKGAFEPSAKLMNLKTTALHWVQKYTKIKHGIFVDIFVADEFPNGKFERFIKKNQNKHLVLYKLCSV